MNRILYNIIICCCIFVQVQAGRKLVGARKVKEFDGRNYRFAVSIWARNEHEIPPSEDSYVCTGSIISTRYVVTAAHCVTTFRGVPEDVYIKAGALHVLSPELTIYNISSVSIHKAYHGDGDDIALLLTSQAIVFDKYVRPISLADKSPPAGSAVTIVGWGVTNLTTKTESENLMKIKAKVFPIEKCKKIDGGFKQIYKRVNSDIICTTSKYGTGTCMGDSGGPVVYNGKLAGVISSGVPCGIGFPDLHMNIASYITWILNKCLRSQ